MLFIVAVDRPRLFLGLIDEGPIVATNKLWICANDGRLPFRIMSSATASPSSPAATRVRHKFCGSTVLSVGRIQSFRNCMLLFRRDWPYFVVFDVLSIDGEDLTGRPLLERKRRLRA
jgi:hypothetical protein